MVDRVTAALALASAAFVSVPASLIPETAKAQSVRRRTETLPRESLVNQPSAVTPRDFGGGYKMGSLIKGLDPYSGISNYNGLVTSRFAPLTFAGGRGQVSFYGQMNLGWLNVDSGYKDTDSYFSTNGTTLNELGTRVRYEVTPDFTVGARLSFVAAFNRSDILTSYEDQDAGCDEKHPDDAFCWNSASLYASGPLFGKISVGLGETAAADIGSITLGGTGAVTNNDPTLKGGWHQVRGTYYTLNDVAPDVTGVTRGTRIRYDSPTFAGFSVSGSWGEASHVGAPPDAKDYWDVALRYAGQFGSIRVATGLAYQDYDREGDHLSQSNLTWGGSIQHVPTGLFASASLNGINRDAKFKPGFGETDNASAYYLQAGISRNVFGIGKTALYGEYGETDNGANAGAYFLKDSSTENWGLGLVQNIDAAAMSLYITYNSIQADVGGTKGDDMNVVFAGARVKF